MTEPACGREAQLEMHLSCINGGSDGSLSPWPHPPLIWYIRELPPPELAFGRCGRVTGGSSLCALHQLHVATLWDDHELQIERSRSDLGDMLMWQKVS